MLGDLVDGVHRASVLRRWRVLASRRWRRVGVVLLAGVALRRLRRVGALTARPGAVQRAQGVSWPPLSLHGDDWTAMRDAGKKHCVTLSKSSRFASRGAGNS